MLDFGTWDAHLALRFRRANGTKLAASEHVGPLRVQRPFYPEGADGPCHVYLLHPPGGVVSGDQLRIAIDVGAGAHAMLTAPGANKFYTARDDHSASLTQTITVAEGAIAEWLPPETIAFEGTRGTLRTRIELAEGATYAGWEILCLGRPAAGEGFERGELRTSFELHRDGLKFLERGLYRGGDVMLRAPWGMHGHPVLATFVVASPHVHADWVERVRAEVDLAVTLVSGVLVMRFLGATTREARQALERAFHVLRPLYAGRPAVHPRIWST